jgi:hypothetical protein
MGTSNCIISKEISSQVLNVKEQAMWGQFCYVKPPRVSL